MFMLGLKHVLAELPEDAVVLDYGCLGFDVSTLVRDAVLPITLHACDTNTPNSIPDNVIFTEIHQNTVPYADDMFDFIILSHVLEHIQDPIPFFGEIIRCLKPGGVVYVEAPSDKAALIKSHFNPFSNQFTSFWDDPTHVRPWPPAALYRLALSYGLDPYDCGYIRSWWACFLLPFYSIWYTVMKKPGLLTEKQWLAHGFSAYLYARKSQDIKGKPEYQYISLKHAGAGKECAMKVYGASS